MTVEGYGLKVQLKGAQQEKLCALVAWNARWERGR
jgi:hypothetical protein